MIIYNVTIKIEWDIAANWVAWMKEEHMPEVMSSDCFVRYQFVRLLQTDESEGPTYAAQYYSESFKKYDQYIQEFAPILRQKTIDKWGAKFIAFRSLMETVE